MNLISLVYLINIVIIFLSKETYFIKEKTESQNSKWTILEKCGLSCNK